MRNVVVIAEPGVLHGWGAASTLAEAAGLEAISVGNLCREEVRRDTTWGREISRYLDAGDLLPDEVIGGLIADALANVDTGWVLFGYPRTVPQAELLADRGHEPRAVVDLVLDEEQIDSDPRLAEKRDILKITLAEHRAQIAPLWAYYHARAKVHTTPGSGDFDEVAARLVTMILPS
jgi:adenylate kinase